MSDPRHSDLARRLFASVRRERAPAALRERVSRAGRAERARRDPEATAQAAGLSGLSAAEHAVGAARRRAEGLHLVPSPSRRANESSTLAEAVAAPSAGWRRVWPLAALAACAAGLVLTVSALRAPPALMISAEGAERARPASGAAGVRDVPSAPGVQLPVSSSERGQGSGAVLGRDESPAHAVASDANEKAVPAADVRPRAPQSGKTARPVRALDPARVEAPQLPGSATRVPVAPPAGPASGTASEPAPGLAEQLARIKQARSALRAGDAAGALAAIERYRGEVQGGSFAAEAALLRIEALAAAGRNVEAAAAARQFAAEYPTSPLIDRALGYAGGHGE